MTASKDILSAVRFNDRIIWIYDQTGGLPALAKIDYSDAATTASSWTGAGSYNETWNPSVWTTKRQTMDNFYMPMVEFNNILYIGNGTQVLRLDTSDVVSD